MFWLLVKSSFPYRTLSPLSANTVSLWDGMDECTDGKRWEVDRVRIIKY